MQKFWEYDAKFWNLQFIYCVLCLMLEKPIQVHSYVVVFLLKCKFLISSWVISLDKKLQFRCLIFISTEINVLMPRDWIIYRNLFLFLYGIQSKYEHQVKSAKKNRQRTTNTQQTIKINNPPNKCKTVYPIRVRHKYITINALSFNKTMQRNPNSKRNTHKKKYERKRLHNSNI